MAGIPSRDGMSENAEKRQRVRDHPSCWIPCTPMVAPSNASVSTVPMDPHREFASTSFGRPACIVARCEQQWDWTPVSEEGACHLEATRAAVSAQPDSMSRLAEAQRRSLKYRNPIFPGAGLLREEGGVFGVMSRAISEGRSSWMQTNNGGGGRF